MTAELNEATRQAFATLGVAPDAPAAAIRRAFRRLALLHHPDRNRGDAGAAARFRHISEAYAVVGKYRAKPAPAFDNPFTKPPKPPPHAPGTRQTRKRYHYPTKAEIAALGQPRGTFRPHRVIAWSLAVGVLTLIIFIFLIDHGHGSPEGPANSWVPGFLQSTSRSYRIRPRF